MSCVVGLVNEGRVYIGSEGRASTCDGEVRCDNMKKIFRNGPYLFGFIGSVRGGQILFPKYFEVPDDVWDMPDAIREQSEAKGCLTATEEGVVATGCNYLIGHKGKLYEILVDFQMFEIETFTAIGSGSNFAFGSLCTTEMMSNVAKITPKRRLELALDAAKRYDGACGGIVEIVKM